MEPGKNFSEIGYRMGEAGQQGLLLGGPKFVAYDRESRLPISCLNVAEALELRDFDFDSYSLITAVDVTTGAFYAGNLIEPKFKKGEIDPDASLPPPGISFDGSAGDLFARLRIPRLGAEYLVTGILLDRVSNRVKIRVGSEAARTDLGKFAVEVKEGAKAAQPRYNVLHTLSLVREPQSPSLPHTLGIDAVFPKPPEKTFALEDALRLYVSYRLPTPPLLPDGKPANAIAFHILATGTRVPTPLVRRVDVPIQPANRAADGSLQGYFSLDANQGYGFEGNQTYSVYLFSGESLGAAPKLVLK